MAIGLVPVLIVLREFTQFVVGDLALQHRIPILLWKFPFGARI